MDRDFDGRLSFEEFIGEESNIEKLFKNMDKNGDGVVTKEVGAVGKSFMRICILGTDKFRNFKENLGNITFSFFQGPNL